MLHAASLRNSGKLDEAETLLRKAMESIRQPDEHGARFLDEYGLASIFMERKNWREAQSRLNSAQPPAEMQRFCWRNSGTHIGSTPKHPRSRCPGREPEKPAARAFS